MRRIPLGEAARLLSRSSVMLLLDIGLRVRMGLALVPPVPRTGPVRIGRPERRAIDSLSLRLRMGVHSSALVAPLCLKLAR